MDEMICRQEGVLHVLLIACAVDGVTGIFRKCWIWREIEILISCHRSNRALAEIPVACFMNEGYYCAITNSAYVTNY